MPITTKLLPDQLTLIENTSLSRVNHEQSTGKPSATGLPRVNQTPNKLEDTPMQLHQSSANKTEAMLKIINSHPKACPIELERIRYGKTGRRMLIIEIEKPRNEVK